MRGKFLLFLGFSAGYVLGSKAGRKRYEQIRTVAGKVWHSGPVQNVADEVGGLVSKVAPGVMEKVGQGTRYVIATVAGINTKAPEVHEEMVEREVLKTKTGKSQAAAKAKTQAEPKSGTKSEKALKLETEDE